MKNDKYCFRFIFPYPTLVDKEKKLVYSKQIPHVLNKMKLRRLKYGIKTVEIEKTNLFNYIDLKCAIESGISVLLLNINEDRPTIIKLLKHGYITIDKKIEERLTINSRKIIIIIYSDNQQIKKGIRLRGELIGDRVVLD